RLWRAEDGPAGRNHRIGDLRLRSVAKSYQGTTSERDARRLLRAVSPVRAISAAVSAVLAGPESDGAGLSAGFFALLRKLVCAAGFINQRRRIHQCNAGNPWISPHGDGSY